MVTVTIQSRSGSTIVDKLRVDGVSLLWDERDEREAAQKRRANARARERMGDETREATLCPAPPGAD